MIQNASAVAPLLDNTFARGPYALLGASPAGLLFIAQSCLRGYSNLLSTAQPHPRVTGLRLPVPAEKRLAFNQRGF